MYYIALSILYIDEELDIEIKSEIGSCLKKVIFNFFIKLNYPINHCINSFHLLLNFYEYY